jgi:hypothetical protein
MLPLCNAHNATAVLVGRFPPWILLERLASEYVDAQLCEAATRAFAAENEARMMAMAAARNQRRTEIDPPPQPARRAKPSQIAGTAQPARPLRHLASQARLRHV